MTTIHEPVSIHESVRFGAGVVVWRYTTICEGAEIGEGTVIGSNVFIGRGSRIGKNVHIQHGAFIPNNALIKDDVFIGPNAVLTDDKHPRAGNPGYRALPPTVLWGASIGAGAVVLPGITVGCRAMVGAGAVVTEDVRDDDTAMGVPARFRLVG